MYTTYYSIILVKIIMTIGFHVCYCIKNNSKKSNDIDMNDITSLSELPIEKLLLLRQSLKHEPPMEFRDFNSKKSSKIKTQNKNDNENDDDDDEDNKDSLNRRTTGWGHEEPYDYHHGHHEYHDENMLWLKSKGDIQTIFQATVTVLAFLAFGGYLICLIVTSFKNGTQNSVVVQQTTTTTTTNRSNKIKRDINRNLYNRFNRKIVNNNYTTTNNTFDDIQILCQIAEGYTKYHTLTST